MKRYFVIDCKSEIFWVGLDKYSLKHVSVFQDDVSGDYKEILLAMIGERPPPAPVAEEEDAGEPELEEVEEEHVEVFHLFFYYLCDITVQ